VRVEFSDERINELREMAEGKRPFAADAVLEKLSDVPAREFRRYAPRERLACGYYAAAELRELRSRRAAQTASAIL
jgi:hypothetical protein